MATEKEVINSTTQMRADIEMKRSIKAFFDELTDVARLLNKVLAAKANAGLL